MPPVQQDQSFMHGPIDTSFTSSRSRDGSCDGFFCSGSSSGSGRMAFIGILAFDSVRSFTAAAKSIISVRVSATRIRRRAGIQRRQSDRQDDREPARVRIPNFEIIVVDDGSSDETYRDSGRDNYGSDPRSSRYLESERRKGRGIEFWLAQANGEIVIALDADTLFTRQTVSALAHDLPTKTSVPSPAMPRSATV